MVLGPGHRHGHMCAVLQCIEVFHPLCSNERNDSRPVDDGSGSHDPEARHGFRPDANHDVRFQVQALGVLGYSDWSTIETIVVN